MSQSLLITLRLLHILAGAIWFGALVVFTFYVMPAISATGPAGRQVMGQLGSRKYPQFVMIMMGVTILTGLGMMWYFSSSVGGEYFRSAMGRTISLGAAAAILTAVFGVVVPRPTAMKLVALGEAIQKGGGTPTPDQAAEMAKLQARMILSTRIVVVGLLIAVAAMAGARYM